MRFGIWTPLPHIAIPPEMIPDMTTYGSIESGDNPYLSTALDVIGRADELGFDVTLVAQRYMGPDLDAWILASVLAARTERIVVMPAVHPGIITPQVVAKFAASLDQISNGRAAINIVNGWLESEFDNFSNGQWLHDSDARYRRMEEFLEVMNLLWSEPSVDYAGEFYTLKQARLPSKPVNGRPKIYGASSSEAGQRSLAKYADVWFVTPSDTVADGETLAEYDARFEDHLEDIRAQCVTMRERARTFGRSINCGLIFTVVSADTAEEAFAIAESLDRQASTQFVEWMSTAGGALVEEPGNIESWLPDWQSSLLIASRWGAAIVGTPEKIEKRIRALADAGLDLLMLKFAPTRAGLETFGTQVMPLLQDLRRQ